MEFSAAIDIDGRMLGHDCPAYIIAEAGVAHFGSEEKAYKLVDLAVDGRADAVKFQIFDVQALISDASPNWKSRLAGRQLEYQAFERIQSYCNSKNITFLATAHDEPSLEFLATLNVPAYKIGSGEVGNWPFIKRTASLGKPVIVSTGMYSLDMVKDVVDAFAAAQNQDLVLLHCSTRYPTPPEEINLKAMGTLTDEFGVLSGYSDHTVGFHIPMAAVALGAHVIEKHISLDFDVPDAQDWKVSCGAHNLAEFISQVRDIEAAFGSSIKEPTEFEQKQVWARKSLIAATDLEIGVVLQAEHLVCKRPGTGISPAELENVVGKRVTKSIAKGALLNWGDVE